MFVFHSNIRVLRALIFSGKTFVQYLRVYFYKTDIFVSFERCAKLSYSMWFYGLPDDVEKFVVDEIALN